MLICTCVTAVQQEGPQGAGRYKSVAYKLATLWDIKGGQSRQVCAVGWEGSRTVSVVRMSAGSTSALPCQPRIRMHGGWPRLKYPSYITGNHPTVAAFDNSSLAWMRLTCGCAVTYVEENGELTAYHLHADVSYCQRSGFKGNTSTAPSCRT